MKEDFIVVTTDYVPNMKIKKVLGQSFGLVVRSRGLGGNIVASLRTIVGGEIKEYTKMLYDARETAIGRLVEHAEKLGANAVVGMGFDSADIGNYMSEIVAYGTAVFVVKEDKVPEPVSLR